MRSIKKLASHISKGCVFFRSRILQLNMNDLQGLTSEDTKQGEEKEVQRMDPDEARVSIHQGIDYQKGNMLITKNFTYFFKEHMFVFKRKVKQIY